MSEEGQTPETLNTPEPSDEARAAIAEEMVLNAAMAFAGQVVAGAQQTAQATAEAAPERLRELIVRQFWLETATLCLRRLGESYGGALEDSALAAHAELLQDGAKRAGEARALVEALGDLGLDLLDRLLESSRSDPV